MASFAVPNVYLVTTSTRLAEPEKMPYFVKALPEPDDGCGCGYVLHSKDDSIDTVTKNLVEYFNSSDPPPADSFLFSRVTIEFFGDE